VFTERSGRESIKRKTAGRREREREVIWREDQRERRREREGEMEMTGLWRR
jgi:hypothetical protein